MRKHFKVGDIVFDLQLKAVGKVFHVKEPRHDDYYPDTHPVIVKIKRKQIEYSIHGVNADNESKFPTLLHFEEAKSLGINVEVKKVKKKMQMWGCVGRDSGQPYEVLFHTKQEALEYCEEVGEEDEENVVPVLMVGEYEKPGAIK